MRKNLFGKESKLLINSTNLNFQKFPFETKKPDGEAAQETEI